MFASILSIGLILALNFSSRISDGQPLQDAYRRVQAEIETLRRQQADLITERDYVRSDAYVANWARSDGKMVRSGEVLVIPVPALMSIEADAQVAPVAIETPAPRPETWLLWWSLFFDSAPPQF